MHFGNFVVISLALAATSAIRVVDHEPGYRVSVPRTKKPSNRVPGYLQDVDFTLQESERNSNDAIRIVEPPKYFQDQKRQFQTSSNNKKRFASVGSDLRAGGSALVHAQPLRFTREQPASSRPTPGYKAHHHVVSIKHPVGGSQGYYDGYTSRPLPYQGVKGPDVNSLRTQLDQINERQKYSFREKYHPLPQSTLSHYGFISNNKDNEIYDEPLKRPILTPKPSYAVREIPQTSPVPETTTLHPYQMLASIRHRDTVSNKYRDANLDLRLRERIKTKGAQTVYTEQGYEDDRYSQEQRQEQRQKLIRKRNRTRNRSKRDVHDESGEGVVEEVEELPVALTLMSSTGQKLSGQALLEHITQLLKDSSKYLPEDTDDDRDDKLNAVLVAPDVMDKLLKQTVNLTDIMQKVPTIQTIAPYSKVKKNCEQLNFESGSERVGQEHIKCMKRNLFGRNPIAKSLPTSDEHNSIQTAFPSLLVYNDVMTNIRNMLKSENTLAIYELPKSNQKSDRTFSAKGKSKKLRTSGRQKKTLSMFDIGKYLPQAYMVKPNGKIYRVKMRPKRKTAATAHRDRGHVRQPPTSTSNNTHRRTGESVRETSQMRLPLASPSLPGGNKKAYAQRRHDVLKPPDVMAVAYQFTHESGLPRKPNRAAAGQSIRFL